MLIFGHTLKGAVKRNNFPRNLSRKKKMLQVARTMLHVTIAMQLLPRKKWPKIKSVEKVVGCDWLTKQVARAMLHVFLLCNLKKFVAENDSTFRAT